MHRFVFDPKINYSDSETIMSRFVNFNFEVNNLNYYPALQGNINSYGCFACTLYIVNPMRIQCNK